MTETLLRIPDVPDLPDAPALVSASSLPQDAPSPTDSVALVGEWRQHGPAATRGWVRGYTFSLAAGPERATTWSIRFRLRDGLNARVNPHQAFTRFELREDGPSRFHLVSRPGHVPVPGTLLGVDLQLLFPDEGTATDRRLLDLTFD